MIHTCYAGIKIKLLFKYNYNEQKWRILLLACIPIKIHVTLQIFKKKIKYKLKTVDASKLQYKFA